LCRPIFYVLPFWSSLLTDLLLSSNIRVLNFDDCKTTGRVKVTSLLV